MLPSLLSLLLLFALAGCEAPSTSEAWPPMWRVTTPTGQTGVILGTLHVVVDAGELPPVVWSELGQARELTTEADVRSINSNDFLRAITLPEGQTIRAAVTDDQWSSIVTAFEGLSSPETLDRLQPWYLEGELTRTRLPQVDTIDTALVDEALTQRVRLAFLESWLGQVQMLNDVGFDEGLALLLATVGDPEAAASANLTWGETYRSGDVEALEQLAFDPELIEARPRFYEEIVYARNDTWLPLFEAALEAGDAFLAVGFMHLLGPRGLVVRLEERGYQVSLIQR